MGDFLKLAYEMRELNKNIDSDYQKLSDKYHNLELSHNRKKKALEKILSYFESLTLFSALDVAFVIAMCEDALFSDGRVNERSKVKQRKKGGAK